MHARLFLSPGPGVSQRLIAAVLGLCWWLQGVASVVAGDPAIGGSTVAWVDELAEDAVRDLAPHFPDLRPAPFQVVLHRDARTMPEPVRRGLHEGTAGVAWLSAQQVHLLLDRMGLQSPGDVRTVLRHEVVHILLQQHAGAAGPYVPRWFHEGLAQELAGSTYLGVSEEDIVFHARTGNLLGFSRLQADFPRTSNALRTAYAQSYSFVSFLRRDVGLEVLLEAAQRCGPDRSFAQAFRSVTDQPLATAEYRWVEYVKSGAGAAWRVLLASCFGLTMVAFLPLLALAGVRRWNRDQRSRSSLQAAETGLEEPSADVRGQDPEPQ